MTERNTEHARQLRFSFDIMTDDDVGEMVGVSTQTLACWRTEGKGPAYVKLGKNVFYRRESIQQWIQNQVVSPGG